MRKLVGRLLIATITIGGSIVGIPIVDSAGIASAVGGDYESIVPVRVYDSRTVAIRPAGSVTPVTVAGVNGVPADAAAVMLNLTAVLPVADGHMTIFPCGAARPNTSNLNYAAGDVRGNAVLAKVGTNGQVCIYTLATSHVVVDLNGYVPTGGSPVPMVPVRRYDSRPTAIRPAGSVTQIQVRGVAGVPANASSVLMNVTAVLPQGDGHLTVFPCGAPRPTASNVNYRVGEVSGNAVFAGVFASDSVCIYTHAATHIVVDLVGYGLLSPETVTPVRMEDTRTKTMPTAGSVTKVKVSTGITGNGVPDDATTVALNVTAVLPQGDGYLTVYPCGSPRPKAASVNYNTGSVRPNMVFAQVGTDQEVCVFTLAASHILVDLSGFVSPSQGGGSGCYIDATWVPTALDQTECDALVTFFQSTGGTSWTNRTGWMTPTDPCGWFRVECANDHVRGLALGENNVQGMIPADIEDLVELQYLTLDHNSITGVPTSIGNLTQLEALMLNSNGLNSLPAQIGNATSLKTLDIGTNNFSALPASIGNLTNLTWFNASFNTLSDLPSSFGNLKNLTYLDLSGNMLTSIPPELENLTNLFTVYLSANSIATIPIWIQDLQALSSLDLADNQLAGTIVNRLEPLTAHLFFLGLSGNLCLLPTPTFEAWLDNHSPDWDDGCP